MSNDLDFYLKVKAIEKEEATKDALDSLRLHNPIEPTWIDLRLSAREFGTLYQILLTLPSPKAEAAKSILAKAEVIKERLLF